MVVKDAVLAAMDRCNVMVNVSIRSAYPIASNMLKINILRIDVEDGLMVAMNVLLYLKLQSTFQDSMTKSSIDIFSA